MHKTFNNLNEAFVQSLKLLSTVGSNVKSRGKRQREILFYSLTIKDPTALSIDVPARRFNPDYAIAEWLWYLSCNPLINNIGKMANIWNLISDQFGEVESNYGVYLSGEQWNWCVQEMLNDRDSRRATMVINQPYHKIKNKEDYPCTQYIQFFIRDNKLHMGVHMRSNDAVYGFCNDVFTFCMFQQLMLNDLNYFQSADQQPIELGEYHHTAGSFHIYETHWSMMNKILNNYYLNVVNSNNNWPVLSKFKLNDIITSNTLGKVILPHQDLSKEEIKTHTTLSKEFLYVS